MGRRGRKRIIVVGIDGMTLPFVKKFSSEGCVPNFRWMLNNGTAGQLLPCLPVHTPTNWATIATGAYQGTTGLSGWLVRRFSDPWTYSGLTSFSSNASMSETIWEAAERYGKKSLTIFHPITWPPRVKKSMVVAPFYSGPGITPLSIAPPQDYDTKHSKGVMSGSSMWSAALQVSPPRGWKQLPQGHSFLETMLHVQATPTDLAADYIAGGRGKELKEDVISEIRVDFPVLIENSCGQGYDRILIYNSKNSSDIVAQLKPGRWSNWIFRKFGKREGSIRFKLLSLSKDGKQLRIARSQVYPTRGFTYPCALAKEIVDNIGPFIEKPCAVENSKGRSPSRRLDIETLFEEYFYQGIWMANTASYLLEKYGWDLYMQHWHIFDGISHAYLCHSDPEWWHYDPVEGPRCLDLVRRAYICADKVLGGFRKMVDRDTYLIAISDHGNVPDNWRVSTIRRLQSKGLLYLSRDDDLSSIEWMKSKVYVIPTRELEVFVNLKGRDPNGIVEPSDYETLQEEIIDVLYSWREPVSKKRPVALALKKRDSQILGFWGDEACGDVVLVYNSGFGTGALPPGRSVSAKRPPLYGTGFMEGGASHGYQVPTAGTKMSSNLAAILITGPDIRQKYEREGAQNGLWRLIDFAPTISHILGFPPPRDSSGRVMYDMFKSY